MIKFVAQYYWTLRELIEAVTGNDHEPWDVTDSFHDIFYTNFASAPVWADSSTANDYIEDLWNLLYARYYNYYTVYTDDEDTAITSDEYIPFLAKIVNLIVLTYPKYSVLLGYYTAQKANLMNQISSTQTGIARFNDTPQTEEANAEDFEDDDHVTNITKTSATNLTDGMTPIERLKQIQDSFKSVMADWCNEFSKLFIEDGNLTL